MKFYPVWSDSMGAKSFSTVVDASGHRIFIDPGVAIMQPSYPGDRRLHIKWADEAYNKIIEYLADSDIVIITHYHHDHYLWKEDDIEYYSGKKLLIKDPNKYINDSQWDRVREFLTLYLKMLYEVDLESMYISKSMSECIDYVKDYKIALSKDFGEYSERRSELLEKGFKWFEGRCRKWSSSPWIKELNEFNIIFIDAKSFKFDDLTLRFTDPLYHGIEYSRTGWVIGVVLEYLNKKIIYSSDIQGPTIEDYAYWIINEDPDILFLDGPPTYLIPYMFNLVNFRRTIDNIKWIIRDTNKLKMIIYDHHLTRDIKFRERVGDIYKYASEYGIEVLDVATYLGVKPAYELVK